MQLNDVIKSISKYWALIVLSLSVGYCVRGTYYPRKICPTGQTFLGKYVWPDRNSCPTLGKFVRPMSGCNFLHES